MKKMITLLMAVMIGISVPITASAAPSPTANAAIVNSPSASAVYVDGKKVDSSVVSVEDYEVPDDLKLTDIDESLSNMVLLTAFDLKINLADFKKVKFTVAVPAIKADDKVAIAQKDGDEWKLLSDKKVKVAEGKLTLTVKKAGPILVMVEK
ncbi:MAG: hypothetical protein Q4B70_07805 [Lachnospiraceae bacterium]|nr:hypothetical protein [Lachnospiraceae bacterium]